MKKRILIIGAGPAGLCAAYELVSDPDIRNTEIVIFDLNSIVGGLSRTETFKGNKIDIGGHRFFSKSDRVMEWWMSILPLQEQLSKNNIQLKGEFKCTEGRADPEKTDAVFLRRSRLSRILYLRKFFSYPINLSIQTIKMLGLIRIISIGFTYLYAQLFPCRPEKTLEDFLINRFGYSLYRFFFRDYTRKVWGVPCSEISSEWGRQRIKGLSIFTALRHAVSSIFRKERSLEQKQIETSLISNFLYPKLGPGQLWEKVANQLKGRGVTIRCHCEVSALRISGNQISQATVISALDGKEEIFPVDAVFSSMPIKNLIQALGDHPPKHVKKVASGLVYRDFITVGVLLKKNTSGERINGITSLPDNWIYVQEDDVLLGRIQLFNNWSPYMVPNKKHIWIGLEYFCSRGDDFWVCSDEKIVATGIRELEKLSLIQADEVLDATVIRVPYAYPAYFGSYERFPEIRQYIDTIENLYCIGRNGTHRYNNTDHSMLSAMTAVDLYRREESSREALWSVNTEQEYHENRRD